MANEVFANGLEIACKHGDGKSIFEFPDVCMTPPTSAVTPIGVPVPYPNTSFSKDTAGGSRTTKIDNQEIMLQHDSYYKTSTGDEAGCATPAKKGIVSGTIKGKTYFIAWSMDVLIEGKYVVRTGDLTTHNHASDPPTGALPAPEIEGVAPPTPSPQDCILRPYKKGCPDKKTPHHCVPDHCFKKPTIKGVLGARLPGSPSHADGLCICVDGATKSTKKPPPNENDLATHGKIHLKFDKLEKALGLASEIKRTAKLGDLENAAAKTIAEETGCNEAHIKKQLREHHKKLSEDYVCRADPSGKAKLTTAALAALGSVTATAISF